MIGPDGIFGMDRSLMCLLDLDLPPDFNKFLRRNFEKVHCPH